jgi:hypothetical protein
MTAHVSEWQDEEGGTSVTVITPEGSTTGVLTSDERGDLIVLDRPVRRYPRPLGPTPDDDTIIAWLSDTEECEATDGCPCEPDGMCPEGYPSWLRYLGYI